MMNKPLEDFIKTGKYEYTFCDENGDDNIYIYVRKFSDSVEYGWGIQNSNSNVRNIVSHDTEKIYNRNDNDLFCESLDNLHYMMLHTQNEIEKSAKNIRRYIHSIYGEEDNK